MSRLPPLFAGLRLPVIASPMFIVSTQKLVIAQCTAGIVGSMPSLSARPSSQLDEWLAEIREALDRWDRDHPDRPAAPFAVNLIVHRSNDRLETDMAICARHRVPIYITSLGSQPAVNQALHEAGGFILHDVINTRFALKAVEAGVDGLIAVAAGAGGHAGIKSPFALVSEIRRHYQGPLALAGAIANGRSILAAQSMGADLAYIGSPFIATAEASASDAQKAAVVAATSDDILYTNTFTGVNANYLIPSIRAAGLDPDNLPAPGALDMGSGLKKRWKDIWGCGQGVAGVDAVLPVAELVERLRREYQAAREELLTIAA
ncbi:NAD(P)H-dependent flavin oxidoreductase [Hydrogenophaga sp. BPS33]|uniref:NAD(P)H-dependent flavin oxidoreductase n=1 Tax=Hydrogenophaga sp. BPS33 TaxID=2651974 RepID=UPI00131FCB2B|nr:nitronate monooxygenase family protein [Hydrogenophaga sp. BPS33]QHE83937.1 nitronate monooxygenase [Hydrogenophaga sp. BPS33]